MNTDRFGRPGTSNSQPAFPRVPIAPLPNFDTTITFTDSFSQPFALIRLFVLALVSFFVVDAGFYQIEMWYTGGRVPITSAILKGTLLAIFLIAVMFRGSITRPGLMKISIVFLGYLILSALYQYFSLGITTINIVSGYNIYYLLFFINILAFCIPLRISDRLLVKLLITLAIPCALLGIAQFVTKSPIVPTGSSDGNFTVPSWSFGGHVKAFSFFDEPADCGIFFSLIASLSVALCRYRRYIPFAFPMLLVSICMCWMAGARTEMLGVVAAVLSAAIFSFWGRRNRGRWLPVLWFVSGVPVAFAAYLLSSANGATMRVTDTSSFTMRLQRWSYFLGMFRASTVYNILLGFGLVQNAKLDPTGLSGSDNMFLANILSIGVIGLAIFLVFLWFIWEDIRTEAETRRSSLYIAVASTFSTVLLLGIYSIVTSYLGAVLLLLSVSKVDAAEEGSSA
jgi:hypothetical protein